MREAARRAGVAPITVSRALSPWPESAAFYGPLQGLEVAVRNAMHREL